MNINRINQNDPFYPSALKKYLGDSFPVTLTATGNLDILKKKPLPFSVQ